MFCCCRELGIAGKAVTPFVLKRINELSNGRSLMSSILFLSLSFSLSFLFLSLCLVFSLISISDIALIKNNAKVGALIALELAKSRNDSENFVTVKNDPPVLFGECVPNNGPVSAFVTAYVSSLQLYYVVLIQVVVGGAILDFTAKAETEIKVNSYYN